MKPDWKDAPEWATWVARDLDGDWYWYEREPRPSHENFFGTGGLVQHCGMKTPWYGLVEKRP